MKYRIEYMGNPDYVTLHVTVKLTDENFVNDIVTTTDTATNELYSLCKDVHGAQEISLHPYSISLKRGGAFDRDEVVMNCLEGLKPWFSINHGVDTFEQLPTLRSDLMYKKCRECQKVEDREWAELARDMDTRDW